MNIYFIRHGQTIANMQKRYLGRSESPVSDEGIVQNAAALRMLSDINFDFIFSSPSKRCLSQALELAAKKNMQALPDPRLCEIDFGRFEGLTWQEAQGKYPVDFKALCDNPDKFTFPGGESQQDLYERACSFTDYIKVLNCNSIAVFSHGGTIMSMLCALLELSPQDKWRFKITHGSIIHAEINEGYAVLVL